MKWKRRRKRTEQMRASYSALHADVELSLFEMGERTPAPVYLNPEPGQAEDVQEDENPGIPAVRRISRKTRKRWLDYGIRHGTPHPEQAEYRLERHRAEQAATRARIESNSAGRPESRFDPRTLGNVGRNGMASRLLNKYRMEHPPEDDLPEEFMQA